MKLRSAPNAPTHSYSAQKRFARNPPCVVPPVNVKLQAQATLATAEQAEVAARVRYNTALLDLARVTGAVLEMNQVKLALPVAARAGE